MKLKIGNNNNTYYYKCDLLYLSLIASIYAYMLFGALYLCNKVFNKYEIIYLYYKN
jgi:hypothetical protein